MIPMTQDDPEVVAFLALLVEINKGRTWSRKNRVEKRWSIPCTKCAEGQVHLIQSASNGHVRGQCTTPNCMGFIE